tara:strand:+ start:62 stop:286 length:225 start_codon:yes stop_codon:yes gene_type:complete
LLLSSNSLKAKSLQTLDAPEQIISLEESVLVGTLVGTKKERDLKVLFIETYLMASVKYGKCSKMKQLEALKKRE